MSAVNLNCLEDLNSTDCLLRAILQVLDEGRDQDNEIDWNPITFAFTLLLGFLASAFAVVTIVQGFLAARKGYRKASKRAISEWSEFRKKEWIQGEFNYQYTAQTPIFRMASLLDSIKDREDPPPTAYENMKFDSQLQSTTAATWKAFFRVTGLDNVKCADGLRSVAVDFLPDDIVAAPAFAQGGVVIAAAAAAGIQRWTLKEDVPEQPVIIGRSFQFDFRQHPILGLIGSFSSHHSPGKDLSVPRPHKLKSTMQHALGIIEACDSPQSGPEKSKLDMDLIRDYESCKDLMENVVKNTPPINEASESEYFYLPSGFFREHVNPAHCLFKAITPKYVPELFPLSASKLCDSNTLAHLAMCGRYWSEVNLDVFGKSKLGDWPERYKNNPPFWGYFRRPGTSNPSGTIEIDQTVLQMCLKQVNNGSEIEEWFWKARPEAQQELRQRIHEQLLQVDYWLRPKEEMDFRIHLLYKSVLLLSQAEKVVRSSIIDRLKLEDEPKKSSKYNFSKADLIQALKDLLDTLQLTEDTLKASAAGPSYHGMGDSGSPHLIHLKQVFKEYGDILDGIAGPHFFVAEAREAVAIAAKLSGEDDGSNKEC